jgi:hypothetical protein
VQNERDWWWRAVHVLWRPREVFAALRDDSDEAAAARQEPVIVLMFAAGVATALGTEAALFEDVSGVNYAVLAFITGAAYAAILYWIAGGLLAFILRHAGVRATARSIRHVLAYAPLAPGVVAWVLYEPLLLGFAVWSLGLLVEGLRTIRLRE